MGSTSNTRTTIYVAVIGGVVAILTTLLTIFGDELKQLVSTWSKDPQESSVNREKVLSIKASSTLNPQTSKSGTKFVYEAFNAIDSDINTAWVEGVRGDGINETLRIAFHEKVKLKHLGIINGYAKDSRTYENNNQISVIEISAHSFKQQFPLLKKLDFQKLNFDEEIITDWIQLKIVDVHRGKLYSDTAISEISFNQE